MIRTINSLRSLCCGLAAAALLATGGPLVGSAAAWGRATVLLQPTTQPGDSPTTQPGGRQRGGRNGGRRGLTTMVSRYHDLVFGLDGLTDDQKGKLNPIFDKAKTDADAVTKEMQDMAPEDRQDRAREFLEDVHGKVAEVLTDDQNKQLEAKAQQMRNRRGGGQGGPGGPGGPPGGPPPPGGNPGDNGPTSKPGGGSMSRLSGDNPAMADIAPSGQASAVATSFTTAPGGAVAGAPRLEKIINRFETALDQVNVTPEQRPKVMAILQGFTERVTALKSEAQQARLDTGAADKLRNHFQDILASTRDELSQTLTAEQLTRLREVYRASIPGSASSLSAHRNTSANAAVVANPGVDVGQPAPAFSLQTIDGKTAKLSDFSGKPLVIVFGCWTDPAFRDHGAALAGLAQQYGSKASFLVIYRRELHPAGGWQVERNKTEGISLPQPTDEAGRIAAAQNAGRKLGASIPMAVDSMDDQATLAYGSQQSDAALVVGSDGKVIYRQNNFQPEGLENALTQAIHD